MTRSQSRSAKAVRSPLKPVQRKNVSTPKSKKAASEPAVVKTPSQMARERLQVSQVPESLPCREAEFLEVSAHIESCLDENSGNCIYISGVPGTGKTATLRGVIRNLQKRSKLKKKNIQELPVPPFDFLEVNGMTLTDPNYAYSLLWEKVSGKKVSSYQAQKLLDDWFDSTRSKKPIVLLMDELDLLVNRKQSVIYNFFNWPNRPNSNLIVIAIANTMDLPERTLSNKISSRLGLTRINFQPYTYQQLGDIIRSRLEGLKLFDNQAIEFCARKVGAVSGDARRALDICRRAAEIAELELKEAKVSIPIVQKAIEEMYASPSIKWLTHCSLHQKLFIYSLLFKFRQTGISESEFGQVATYHIELCRTHNLEPPSTSQLASICMSLSSSRIVLTEAAKADLFQRIRLNVPEEDVLIAFRKDEFMKRLIK